MGLFNHSEEQQQLHVDETAKAYLLEAARWAKFISIFGIVVFGLMIMGGVSIMLMGSVIAGAIAMGVSPFTIGFIYIVMSLVYLYPMIALLRFSTRIKMAIVTENHTVLHEAFRFLKNHFKSIGILIIVMIFLYALVILFFIVMSGTALLAS